MLAARLHGSRDLRVEEVSSPSLPHRNEVLVRVSAAGVCGSDLHTYVDYRIGDTEIGSPLILGHEFAGTIEQVGEGTDAGLKQGMLVAVDPAQPCGECDPCREGNPHLCVNMKFCGLSPTHGCFCQAIVVPAHCCVPLPHGLDAEAGALLEPLGIALHACDLAKARARMSAAVLGCGPIGLLILQVAKLAGVDPIFVVEPLPWRMKLAQRWGGIPLPPNEEEAVRALVSQTKGRGVDVVFEAAWGGSSIQLAAEFARPGGRLILVGIPSDDTLLLKHSTARRKGLSILLSRRMTQTYPRAIKLVSDGTIDVKSLISHRFGLEDASRAFELNSKYEDRVVKVIIDVK